MAIYDTTSEKYPGNNSNNAKTAAGASTTIPFLNREQALSRLLVPTYQTAGA